MRIHVLGIGGTFMGSLALLARQAGHEVSGCDANVYPPMSELLVVPEVVVSLVVAPEVVVPEATTVDESVSWVKT